MNYQEVYTFLFVLDSKIKIFIRLYYGLLLKLTLAGGWFMSAEHFMFGQFCIEKNMYITKKINKL